MAIDAETTRPIRAARCLATLLLALSSVAAGQTIEHVSPDRGVFGTEIVISGSGFGEGKPKVRLVEGAGEPGPKLRVLEHDEVRIVAMLRKGVQGAYSLAIQPKGAPAPVTGGRVDVMPPSVDWLDRSYARPGDEVVIYGAYFGDEKKGRVRVGRTSAPITDWTDSTITFRVPDVCEGVYEVSVTTKHGTVVAVEDFDTLGGRCRQRPTPPPSDGVRCTPRLTAVVGGRRLQTSGARRVGYVEGIGCWAGDCISIGAAFGHGKSGIALLLGDYHPAEGPRDFSDDCAATLGYEEDHQLNELGDEDVWLDSCPSLRITDSSGGVLSGTFSGTLTLAQGTGVEVVTISDGTFSCVASVD
jgi:hypothetical protein